MSEPSRYGPGFRNREVRPEFELQGEHASQRAAIGSISAKVGCTAETIRKWARQGERHQD